MTTVLPHEKPGPLPFGPVSTSKPGLCEPRCFAPIKYFSSDRIMTWCICRLCSFSRYLISGFQICDPTNIRWVAIENPWMSVKIYAYFTATRQISARSQFSKQEVKDRLELHNLRIHHVMIRSELEYLIRAKNVATAKWTRGPVPTRPKNTGFWSGPRNKPAKALRFGFLAGQRTEPNRTAGQKPDLLLTLTTTANQLRQSGCSHSYHHGNLQSPN